MRLRLSLLVMLALALRLWGINFGLPFVFPPDEPAHVLEPLAVIRGLPGALTFANPPLFKFVLVGVYEAVFQLGQVVGAYSASADLADQLPRDNSRLFLVARGTSAVLGALTVVGVYWLTCLLRSQQTALIAAGLASATYLLVRESHFAVNDTLVTLCVTLALVGCVSVVRCGARRDYVAAGAAVGLAFAAKYQGAAVLGPLMLAHLLGHGPRRHSNLALSLGAALVTALVAFPPVVLEPGRVLADVYVFLILPARLGYDGIDPTGGYAYYVQALGLGIGWPMLTLASIGLARAVLRREATLLVLASLPLSLFAVMGASHMYFARFLLPAIPALIVLAAVVLDDLARSARPAAALLVVFVIGWTLLDSLRFDALLTHPDTRLVARAWIGAHLPPGALVAIDGAPLGVPLSDLPQQAVASSRLYDATLDEYRQQGVQYVVTSSFTADARPVDLDRDTRRRTFYVALQREAEQLAQFRPYSGTPPDFVYDRIYAPFDSLARFEQPGPTVTVFRLCPGICSP